MNFERLRVGLIFDFNPKWMGGIIYLINIVKTLNYLNDSDKPELFIFYNINLKKFLNEFTYPYLNLIEWSSPKLIEGHIKSWVFRNNLFYDNLIKEFNLNTIYPANKFPIKNHTNAKVVAWYADLQHKYYPEFFSRATLFHRNFRIKLILKNAGDLVVSSQSVKSDFCKFYKLKKSLRIHIFHFTSVNDDYNYISFEILKAKYSLPDSYFLVSNQFHKHKNHKVILLALAQLKKKGLTKIIAMTGKLPEANNSFYMQELHQIINENDLHSQIIMLGLIPRNDQLNIMLHSQAVLQPSLFEGWSTVIEDAISLQIPVIASNLNVNIEQLKDKGVYFHPNNPDELASILETYRKRTLNQNIYGNYSKRIKNAAAELLEILKP